MTANGQWQLAKDGRFVDMPTAKVLSGQAAQQAWWRQQTEATMEASFERGNMVFFARSRGPHSAADVKEYVRMSEPKNNHPWYHCGPNFMYYGAKNESWVIGSRADADEGAGRGSWYAGPTDANTPDQVTVGWQYLTTKGWKAAQSAAVKSGPQALQAAQRAALV